MFKLIKSLSFRRNFFFSKPIHNLNHFSSSQTVKNQTSPSAKITNFKDILKDYKNTIKLNDLIIDSYIEAICLKEIVKYINQRNIDNGSLPHKIDLKNDDSNSQKTLYKIIGESSLAINNSYWSYIDLNTNFQDIIINKYELFSILSKISKKLDIDPYQFIPLCKILIDSHNLNKIEDVYRLIQSFREA